LALSFYQTLEKSKTFTAVLEPLRKAKIKNFAENF